MTGVNLARRLALPLALGLLLGTSAVHASDKLHAARIDRRYSCPALFTIPDATIPAAISTPIAKHGYAIGIGSAMSVDVGKGEVLDGQFLGRLFQKDGTSTDLLFYHHAGKRIYLLNIDQLKLKDIHGNSIQKKSMQRVLDPIEQSDEICMGHVGEHLFHQLKLNYEAESWASKLTKATDTEEERTLLFAGLSNAYYATKRNNSNFGLVMRKSAKKLDLECKSVELKRPNAPSTKALIEAKSHKYIADMKAAIDQGFPVAIEYFIGPTMVKKPVKIVDLDKTTKSDHRIWLPKAPGERSASGHGALLAGYFTAPNGREQFLILDSNWSEPRVFDVEDDVRKRMFSSAMIMHYCHP